MASALDRFLGAPLKRSPLYEAFRKRIAPHKGVRVLHVKSPVPKELVARVVSSTSVPFVLRVAVGLAFAGMLRVSEYTPPDELALFDPAYHLTRADIVVNPSLASAVMRIKGGKTDIARQGAQVPFVATQPAALCCVAGLVAYVRWFDATQRPRNGPFFLFEDGSPMQRFHVSDVLKQLGVGLGFTASELASHSLRHGGAMALCEAGMDWETICTRGRWSLRSANAMAVRYARFSVARVHRVASALNLSGPSAYVFPQVF